MSVLYSQLVSVALKWPKHPLMQVYSCNVLHLLLRDTSGSVAAKCSAASLPAVWCWAGSEQEGFLELFLLESKRNSTSSCYVLCALPSFMKTRPGSMFYLTLFKLCLLQSTLSCSWARQKEPPRLPWVNKAQQRRRENLQKPHVRGFFYYHP